jgi:TonB family protein
MHAELIRWLLESACASTAAIVVVLLARRPWRGMFGANAAYLLWALVPLAIVAASLPAREVAMTVALGQVRFGAPLQAVRGSGASGIGPLSVLLTAWLLGVAAAAIGMLREQRRFSRSLGELREDADGYLRAASSRGLPAVLGLRARIVLPADFETRYCPEERALVLAHEHIHRRRGDLAANALMTALCCVYWFNPLAWFALARFRCDQELACDASVLARHPHARRRYGEAMLKTELAATPAPMACHWFGGHPLKERISMLKQPIVRKRRAVTGMMLATVLLAGCGYAAWAARPPVQVRTTPPPVIPAAALAASSQRATDRAASVDIQSKNATPPKYPAAAAKARITGEVVLIVDVAADGRVADVRVEKSRPQGVFDQVTLDAARRWTFEPARKDGKPVPGRIRVPVTFAMDAPGAGQAAPGGNGQHARRPVAAIVSGGPGRPVVLTREDARKAPQPRMTGDWEPQDPNKPDTYQCDGTVTMDEQTDYWHCKRRAAAAPTRRI